MSEVVPLPKPVKGPPLVHSEVFAMVIFVFAEVMFFAGFLSAFELVGARAPAGWWPPPGDPALPVAATGGATVALVLSGLAVFWAGSSRASATRALTAALALGAAFVAYQGYEFVRLVRMGFTMVSSAHGGFFYTVVGAHALHALAAAGVLGWALLRLQAGTLGEAPFRAVRIFWYFVVLLWPAIYAVVYL